MEFRNAMLRMCMMPIRCLFAVLASYERTYLRKEAVMNLYMLLRFYLPKIPFGHVVEFGSYLGGSAIFLAKVAKEFLPKVKVIGFDTFSGMPAFDPSIGAQFEGQYNDTDLQGLREFVSSNNLGNLIFLKVILKIQRKTI